ncbi:arabinose operon transcriptional regulator AraC [Tropicimonas marinistellae]|uniref:arabinose operon transcriptional regulator AraC n=1 Tax=Tropicimonas marinistellae TaxID=1739787 RepID=UPI00082B2B53|nr:arabinose operon transcriptional regulator AraC [Tropicimonas marinistellae]
MDDHPTIDPKQDPQVRRIIRKLAFISEPPKNDTQVASLFPGFNFDVRLVAGITPIERGGLLDFFIDRPEGLNGWIINLTVDGVGQVFDGENEFTVSPGDLLLIPAGVRHYYGRHPDSPKWWHRWIYFQPRAFWKPWLSWERETGGVFLLPDGGEGSSSEFFRLFVEVEKWSVLDDPLSIDLAFNRLEHILLSAARIDQATKAVPINMDERVLAACNLITENLHKPLTVAQIADHVCLSPSRLSHLFRSYVGTGLLQWRDAQRVQYAMQMLRITNEPIKSLSVMVGYEDPLYFSRVFRRHAGMSPRTFRERSMRVTSNEPDEMTADN